MSVVIALGLTSLILCLLLTPMVRDVFARLKLVDLPDDERKFHLKATPRVGGIAIMASYMGSLGLVLYFAPPRFSLSPAHSTMLAILLPATGLIFFTGLIDDLLVLKPWQKLIGQSLAAGIAVNAGVHLAMPRELSWLSIPISFLWLLACANGLNLIDGMDGLASGVALFATGATLVMALLTGNIGLAVATAPLAGCLAAFLRYNSFPATIFLGDCGSLTIGFMLGCFGLLWSQRTGGAFGLAAPLMLLALPLADVMLAIGRRFLRSTPIFRADRFHIHHKVLTRAGNPRKAVLVLYGVCGVCSSLALLLSFSGHPWISGVIFVLLACVGISHLRYVEFTAALSTFSRRSMLRGIREEIYLHELQQDLAGAETIEAIWDVACGVCDELHFTTLRMTFDGRAFERSTKTDVKTMTWAMTIPLGQEGELSLTRGAENSQPRLMAAVLDCLQSSIAQKELTIGSRLIKQPTFTYWRESLGGERGDGFQGRLGILDSNADPEVSNTVTSGVSMSTIQ